MMVYQLVYYNFTFTFLIVLLSKYMWCPTGRETQVVRQPDKLQTSEQLCAHIYGKYGRSNLNEGDGCLQRTI